MATESKIQLSPSHRPVFAVPKLEQASADRASELLQENHEKHHIYWNEEGFHNHIVHHILSIYALGATPAELESGYKQNASHQLSPPKTDESVYKDMKNESTFKKYLGQNNRYSDYLMFFKQQIKEKGWQDVVNEYLFAGTERSEDMLVRLFGGFLHPIIHLGFGIEFDQPAIIAEALAQTATHDTWMGAFLQPAEKLAKTHGDPSKSLLDLLKETQGNKTLINSIRDEDGNKLRDGVIPRAGEEMTKLAAQYVVPPNELEARCSEMMDLCAYYTITAQRPDKDIRMDFFLMHDANCSIFFPAFLFSPNMSFLSAEHKARLLEWKARTDLAQYVARGTPTLRPDEVTNYTPRQRASTNGSNGSNGHADTEASEWAGIFRRAAALPDDGHTSKLVRMLAASQARCAHGGLKNGAVADGMWVKMAHMVIDANELADVMWVRSTGLDSA